MFRFVVVFSILAILVLVGLMFSKFRKKIGLAFKLMLVVYVVSALSRLRQESDDMQGLLAAGIGLGGILALWGILWLYANWHLSRRQRGAAAGASEGKTGAASQMRRS